MTYCVGIRLDAGLVFLSDSRTNAGLDQISTFRKMMVYEKPGDRFMVLLSAGNLSISQSVREILQVEKIDNGDRAPPITIWNATSMFDAARVLGSAVRRVYDQDGPALQASRHRLQRQHDLRRPDQGRGDAAVPGLFGRQLHRGHARDLLLPDRRIASTASRCSTACSRPSTPLDEAAKCALVSMDSTLKSNLSVGPAAGPAGLPRRPACAADQHRLHRRAQPVLPDDPQHLGPAAARGVRVASRTRSWDGGDATDPLLVASSRVTSRCARSRDPARRIV